MSKKPGHEAAHGGRRRCPHRHGACTPALRSVRLIPAPETPIPLPLPQTREGRKGGSTVWIFCWMQSPPG
ncbi:hypothetical protein NSB25_28500 [Acetatifactor muris]|nr:hypothetical protein [Acetatifactor muris]